MAAGGNAEALTRAGVRVTHPDRVLFADQGLSKSDLIDYYEAVADLMLPHVANRPLSLVRCPGGRERQCFFQKHDTGGFPKAIPSLPIEEGSGAVERYYYIADFASIVAAVQMGVLEFHLWGCRVDALEKPDRLVFDLDPDTELDFAAVRNAALDVRDRLAALGLTSFAMATGGKGFHVIAPLTRRAAWPEVKAFAKAFAARLAKEAPDRYVANMAKAERKGRIFVDYLRNERGSTAIAPYSTRARARAPVATPLAWDEVPTLTAANGVNVATMPERAQRGDPWPGYFDVKQSITKAMSKAVGAA